MTEIVNLRRARKQRLRAEKERQAQENRAKFGRTKADKLRAAAETDRDSHHLDQARLTSEE